MTTLKVKKRICGLLKTSFSRPNLNKQFSKKKRSRIELALFILILILLARSGKKRRIILSSLKIIK